MNFTISATAKKTGLSTYTLRYYEKEGLIKNIQRTENGRRFYSEQDIELIKSIDCLKKTGMSIESIKKYMKIFADDQFDDSSRIALFKKQREKIKEKMAELQDQLEMANYKIWYYENIGSLVDKDDPLHCEKMEAIYSKKINKKH
ncbi:MerR family transcriptional regulator [Lactobacillus sp. AN1001]